MPIRGEDQVFQATGCKDTRIQDTGYTGLRDEHRQDTHKELQTFALLFLKCAKVK